VRSYRHGVAKFISPKPEIGEDRMIFIKYGVGNLVNCCKSSNFEEVVEAYKNESFPDLRN